MTIYRTKIFTLLGLVLGFALGYNFRNYSSNKSADLLYEQQSVEFENDRKVYLDDRKRDEAQMDRTEKLQNRTEEQQIRFDKVLDRLEKLSQNKEANDDSHRR